VKLLLGHANACVFGIGLVAALRGIALWSPPAAYVVGGTVLMFVGAWPYLRVRSR
jgi:hypothetical protein